MDGLYATGVLERRCDLSGLDDGRFWAISISYEGEIVATSFASVVRADFPYEEWDGLKGNWSSSLSQDEYENYVDEIREGIARGDVYQANACRVLSTSCVTGIAGLFSAIQRANPAPFSAYYKSGECEIASASPELFLRRQGDLITSSPIKGTRRITEPPFGEKDKAENIMIVDLIRNDIGQIATNIQTPQLLREEEHPGLVHLVSDVTGELRPGMMWREIFERLLPAGSISGAPKSSAMNFIARREMRRGPYCGVLGWVQGDQALVSVAIRIFWREHDLLCFGAGAGITWGSDPQREWEETELKASRLVAIASGSL